MKTKLVLASFAALSFTAFAHAQAIALAMDPSVGRLPELVVFDLSPAAHRSIGVLPELVVFDRSPASHRSVGVLPELVVYANRLQHRVDAAQGARDLRAQPINGRSSSQSQTSTAASPALATQPSAAGHDSSAKDDTKTVASTTGT